MKNIKDLGSGCANCQNTIEPIAEASRARGVPIALEKVEDLQEIMRYGVMSSPGVVIDGQVVHAGGVPPRAKVVSWF